MDLGNVLIFGGTGMLAEATEWIATHSTTAVIYGRDTRKLERLANTHGVVPETLDYNNINEVKEQVTHAYEKYGSIDMVVAWIHSTSPHAISEIKDTIRKLQPDHQWTLIVVKGSSKVSDITGREQQGPDNCSVKEVRLGFILSESGWRWLTHEEISGGVIQAITGNDEEITVGRLEPWEKRQ
ncbi:Rossmann-fold NAD(P)-binding domain-containing protein [Salimicrobium flavidum]|uniref:Short chain dehydrogenase n=1 Tax=Salimicrobium flavidum TaxID=570947 RepID=A0A1N7KMC5_9BACI|nr:hypothetical protein [Salimicrobium flavidum]SIS62765.1 hypothetical protein SAMN05421687_11412 [Salimicrobium flavidum]